MSTQTMKRATSEESSRQGTRTWEQVWLTVKLLLLFGVGFGGLWLLDQMVAQ